MHTSDDSHDERVGNGRLDMEGLLIESLQLLVVLLLSVHLNLQGIDLKQLCAFLHVIHSIHCEAGLMQLLDDPCQASVVPTVEAQLAKLHRQRWLSNKVYYMYRFVI